MKIAKAYTNFKPEEPSAEYKTVLDTAVDVANDQLLPDLNGSPMVLVLSMDHVEVFGHDSAVGQLHANTVSKAVIVMAMQPVPAGQVRLAYKLGGVEGCCDVLIES